MKTVYLGVILLAAFLLPGQGNLFAAPQTYELQLDQSYLKFSFKAAGLKVRGKAKTYKSSIVFDPETRELSLPAEVEIDAEELTTYNFLRNRDMRKVLEVDAFPKVQWKLTSLECSPAKTDNIYECSGDADMTIRDVTKKIGMNFSHKMTAEGLFVSGDADILLSDFEIKAPALLGLIKADDLVNIRFETLWTS